jgi:hypothetical protein
MMATGKTVGKFIAGLFKIEQTTEAKRCYIWRPGESEPHGDKGPLG